MNTPPPSTTHPRHMLGQIHLTQVLFCELVIAGLLFVRELPWTWVGGASAVILLATFGYSRGNWWYVHLWRLVRLKARKRQDEEELELDAADLGPTLQLSDVNERNINLGVAFDGTGWFAGLAVENDDAPHAAFNTFTKLLNESDVPISSVQLVSRSMPMRHKTDDGDSEHQRARPYVVRRDSWFLMRLDVRGAHPVAANRGGGAVGINRAFVGVVGRLVKGATRKGISMRPLSSLELNDAVRESLGTDASHTGLEQGDIGESWKSWRLGETRDVTFTLTGRIPSDNDLGKLWTAMKSLSCDAQTVSIALRRASDRPAEKKSYLRCLVRLSADEKSIEDTCRKLTETARKYNVRLRRGNGVQGPAAYASAASGGAW